MGTRRPGSPVWVDLITPDLGKAIRFYSELFGWEISDRGEEYGHYHIARSVDRDRSFGQEERETAGLIQRSPDISEESPDGWFVYLHTEHVATTLDRVRALGGQVFYGPVEVDGRYGPEGVLAFLTDPVGAVVGLWEPGLRTDLSLGAGHGRIAWVEGVTPDLEASVDFYRDAFDMSLARDGDGYYLLGTQDDAELGIGSDDELEPDSGAHWHLYFTVDDTDEAAQQVQALGGSVLTAPHNTPAGRMALCTDDQGAAFLVAGPTLAEDSDPTPV